MIRHNEGSGIFIEISGNGVIRSNSVSPGRRQDIYLANSHDVEVFSNTVRTLSSGVELFQDGQAVSQGDLNNDSIHDNRIRVIAADALAARLYCINLTATELLVAFHQPEQPVPGQHIRRSRPSCSLLVRERRSKDVVGVAGTRARPRGVHPFAIGGSRQGMRLARPTGTLRSGP